MKEGTTVKLGTTVGIAAMAMVLAIGCSGDDDSSFSDRLTEVEAAEEAPACADVYAPGRATADVYADVDSGQPCMENGSLTLQAGFAYWDCPDGRRVYVAGNATYGWGFSDGPWNGSEVPEPYADCVLPGSDPQHP